MQLVLQIGEKPNQTKQNEKLTNQTQHTKK